MSKIKSLVAVAAAAGLLMTGIAPSHAAGKTLTLGAVADVANFAASQGEYGNRVWYYQAVYDTLLRKKADDTLLPSLATSWSYDKTQTVLTLKIRAGQKFTDGTPEDAAAVVKNIVANRDSKGPAANYLASVADATAPNATTVVLKLSQVDPAVLENLAETAGLIEAPSQIGAANEKTVPIGAGPYTFDAANSKFGDHYTFVKNPGFWGAKDVTYDTVTIKYIQDATAMVNALETGAVQGANVATNSAIPGLKAAGLKTVSAYLDCLGIYFSDRFGKQVKALKDVRVRQAMNMVFDRKAMLQAIDGGAGKVTEQYYPSQSPAYEANLNNTYKYDVAGAKKLMAAAGYSKGFTLPMPTLAFYFGQSTYDIIAAQLAKINIKVDGQAQTGATFITDLQAPKWPASLMQFERAINGWKMLNFMVTPNSLFNNDHYTDATSAKLLKQIQNAKTLKDSIKLQKQLNEYMVKNAWFLPFYEKQANFAFKGINVSSAQAGNVIPYLYNIK